MENENEKMKCYACGKLASPAEFPVVHGDIGPNIGICRECSRKGIMVSVSSEPPAKSKPITKEEYEAALEEFALSFNAFLEADVLIQAKNCYWKALKALTRISTFCFNKYKERGELYAE